MRWEAGFQGLQRGEKRSIQHVCKHFRPKHNAEITFPARLFSVRNSAHLADHRNLHLTRFCRKTKKSLPYQREVWRVCLYSRMAYPEQQTLFSVRNGTRLAYHRNLHLTRFCRQAKKSLPYQREVGRVCLYSRMAYPGQQTLFSVRNGTRLAYHRNLHLTRFCRQAKKASLIKGRFGGFVYIAGWRTRSNRLYLAYETARVSRITVIFT